MASNGDVVGGGDMAMGLGSRCRCPADWSRLGYMAGSRSRMVGGIGSWKGRVKSRAGVGGRSLAHPYVFISHRTVEGRVRKNWWLWPVI